jgi:hypothetical protein
MPLPPLPFFDSFDFLLFEVGERLGIDEGDADVDGSALGLTDGVDEGDADVEGIALGLDDGTTDGADEGTSEGAVEGDADSEGIALGLSEGAVEGDADTEGIALGLTDGVNEGAADVDGIALFLAFLDFFEAFPFFPAFWASAWSNNTAKSSPVKESFMLAVACYLLEKVKISLFCVVLWEIEICEQRLKREANSGNDYDTKAYLYGTKFRRTEMAIAKQLRHSDENRFFGRFSTNFVW